MCDTSAATVSLHIATVFSGTMGHFGSDPNLELCVCVWRIFEGYLYALVVVVLGSPNKGSGFQKM